MNKLFCPYCCRAIVSDVEWMHVLMKCCFCGRIFVAEYDKSYELFTDLGRPVGTWPYQEPQVDPEEVRNERERGEARYAYLERIKFIATKVPDGLQALTSQELEDVDEALRLPDHSEHRW